MAIIQRGYNGEADQQAMAALALAFPHAHLHAIDLPWRFSSWALDEPDNIALWTDARGRLLAWAVMQTPFWTIDYACHPDAEPALHGRVLSWAQERARAILDTPYGRPCWIVPVLAGQAKRIRDLEAAGFCPQADVGENSWSKMWMQRPAGPPPAECPLPEGFALRPLAGESDVAAYVELQRAVFESRSMTVEWRARTLRHPDHLADLDLVVAAPDGRLAAFCIGWLHRQADGKARGQVEPLGVHPDFRNLGLGRLALSEVLRRLYLHGAEQIYVETDNYRGPALDLYEAAGFQAIEAAWVYRQDFPGRQENNP